MRIHYFAASALILVIATLIAGLSACDQIQQLILPETPQMEGLSGEISIGAVHPITGRLGLENPAAGDRALNSLSQRSITRNATT